LQKWLFWGFFFAFAIKVPMFPFHTWLPDAHTEAPTAGSVILAGVLAEDGHVRIHALLAAAAARTAAREHHFDHGDRALVDRHYLRRAGLHDAEGHEEADRVQSVSHLGFCTLGIFALTPLGFPAALFSRSITEFPPARSS
jgi:NADH-quinone oxidoreductase subunit M